MVGGLRDVITCAELQIEIFMGYDFTGGRIFDFPIDFSMGLTTVQRYCAACDHTMCLFPKLPQLKVIRDSNPDFRIDLYLDVLRINSNMQWIQIG